MSEGDLYYEMGECCATCSFWKVRESTVYGICDRLHILTEEEFYCSDYEMDSKYEEEEESQLQKELNNNPNYPFEEKEDE